MAQPCPQCNMRAQLLRGGRSMTSISRLPSGGSISTCSVAAIYKPSMLVPRVRLPAGAYDAPAQTFHCRLVRASYCCTPAVQPANTPAYRPLVRAEIC